MGGYIWVKYGAGLTGQSVTQLRYTPPPSALAFSPALGSEPLVGDEVVELTWTTDGAPVGTVDIRLGIDGDCHDLVVAQDLPNTGSYLWTVPNLGNERASLLIHASGGTELGYGMTAATLDIIGHRLRYVSTLGSNTAPYESPATAAHSIAAAVAACTGLDTVLVRGDTYLVAATVSRPLRLIGGWNSTFTARDPALWPTRLQSAGSALRFVAGAGDFCGVEGMTFENCIGGFFSSPVGGQHGGAIYSSGASPLIRDCRFIGNRAAPGAGTGYGGAICFVGGSPVVEDCEFSANQASRGGAVGVYAGADVLLRGNVFVNNACTDSAGTNLGAAVCAENSLLRIDGGRIQDNGSTGRGGAVAAIGSGLTLDGVDVLGNRALGGGGGLHLVGGSLAATGSRFEGNSIGSGNGGGVEADGAVLDLRNLRLRANRAVGMGGGISAFGAAGLIENCLLDGNTAASGGGAVVFGGSSPMVVRNSIVAFNAGGGLLAAGSGRRRRLQQRARQRRRRLSAGRARGPRRRRRSAPAEHGRAGAAAGLGVHRRRRSGARLRRSRRVARRHRSLRRTGRGIHRAAAGDRRGCHGPRRRHAPHRLDRVDRSAGGGLRRVPRHRGGVRAPAGQSAAAGGRRHFAGGHAALGGDLLPGGGGVR